LNSPIDLGLIDDALALDTLRSEEENVLPNCPLVTVLSNASESLPAPQNPSDAGLSTTLPARTANPDHTLETHDLNNNLLSIARHTRLAKHAILDESGHLLEDVIKTLGKADDTSHISNSYVLSVSDYLLTKSTSTDYSKIMTSVVMNCVRCNRKMARPALDIEQERLRDYERHELERITKD